MGYHGTFHASGTATGRAPVPVAGDLVQGVPARRARESLSEDARALMNSLPDDVPVTAIALDFPHVLNRIADAWEDATAFEGVLRDLLLDTRGDREGFPIAVEEELETLQAHWLDRAGRY
jgi:hypothetical protein